MKVTRTAANNRQAGARTFGKTAGVRENLNRLVKDSSPSSTGWYKSTIRRTKLEGTRQP